MNEELLGLVDDLKRNKQLLTFDEAATKQAVVLRVLKVLGWDQFNVDEVHPEYSVGSKKVDFALKHNGKIKVFLEVKKIGEDLEKHQEQLLSYSFQEGVKLAVLTNGISWWFYLPLREGNWEQRKFYTIELSDQESKDIAEKFEAFLSKDSVVSGKAIEYAERIYKSKESQELIERTLPRAWEKIITEPDELLVELLADTVEKICGYKPDSETTKQFLMQVYQKERAFSTVGTSPQKQAPSKQISPTSLETYTGKSIVAFTFGGRRYPVHSWKELLITIANLMLSAHREQFEKVLTLRGRKRPYFSKNRNELRGPERIKNTDLYVETNLSANSIVRLSRKIIAAFGHEKDDLLIEVR